MDAAYATLGVVSALESLAGVNITALVNVDDTRTERNTKAADGRFVSKEVFIGTDRFVIFG